QAVLAPRLAVPAPARPARARAHSRVRRSRRWAQHAGFGLVGRQSAETRRGPRGGARPEGAGRSPADPWARRRGRRVSPPPSGRGAKGGAGDHARFARARRGALAVGPDSRHVRGADRCGTRGRRHRGGDRVRDARWAAERGCRMSEPLAPHRGPQPQELSEEAPATPAARLALFQQAGGVLVPVLTAVVAFLIGGIVIAATGHDPLQAYWDILKGAGLNWLAHPWDTNIAHTAPYNSSQTLLQTTTLILCGLAVAFAFRCGLFNIGGNGQYIVGLICANWVGVSFVNMARPAHILLGIAAATAAGAAWAAIAGFLKATVGAPRGSTPIMLKWSAYWMGNYVFQQGGPLQAPRNVPLDIPISADVAKSAQLPVFWGNPVLQGLHIGFFVAIGALVLFWVILSRTTLGFEVRAVGYNPAAAAYGGIRGPTNYPPAMAISGSLAGLAGGLGMLGYLHHYRTRAVQATQIGFLGIAVALLGRSTAVGVGIAALLFGGLVYGTTHGLQSGTIDPGLAGHLTEIIQGLVVLFVGADVLILAVWNSRKRLRRERPRARQEPQPEAAP